MAYYIYCIIDHIFIQRGKYKFTLLVCAVIVLLSNLVLLGVGAYVTVVLLVQVLSCTPAGRILNFKSFTLASQIKRQSRG